MVDIASIMENLPHILPRDPASVIKRYVDAHDEEVDELEGLLDTVQKSRQIDEADGGQPATGTVEFTVTEDSISEIEKGTVVATQPDSDGNYLSFKTTETVSVGGGGSATFWGNNWNSMSWALGPNQNTVTVDADIESVEAGTKYNVSAGEITYLPNSPAGIQSVTNNSATSGGIITDLDQIGAMFGRLGKRGGRGDEQYRAYLRAIVPAFKGRGTIPSLKSVIAAGVAVDDSDIDVNEHYQDLEYTLILYDWQSHQTSTIEELAELADASVSDLRKTRYRTGEEVSIDDGVDITEGLQISDETAVDDAVTIDGNKFIVGESVGADDAVTVDGNTQTVDDSVGVDDNVTTSEYKVQWNDGSWESMRWAVQQ